MHLKYCSSARKHCLDSSSAFQGKMVVAFQIEVGMNLNLSINEMEAGD